MIAESFLEYLKYEKRYSPHTIAAYKTDLNQFAGFLQSEYDALPHHAAAAQIRHWLSGLVLQGNTAKSVNRKISSLKSFFRYLEIHHDHDANPMHKVTAPKIPARLPVYVPEDSMQSLFEQFEFPKDFKGLRDKLILETFYCTGMRLAELTSLRHTDIDLHKGQIRVTGKGNKERIIPMVASLMASYKDYLAEKKRIFDNNTTNLVFVTDKGKKIYPRFVYRVVNFYLSSATTVSKRSPHVLRHSFATHMLSNGADINAIKDLLGHANLSATEVYTHNTVEKIKSVYKQAHPKA